MARAAKVCGHPGCANLAPCPDHRRLPWERHNRRSSLSGSKQQKRARQVLARDGYVCAVCGAAMASEADHRIPLGEGGADTIENMQAVCKPCHRLKSQEEAQRGRVADTAFRP